MGLYRHKVTGVQVLLFASSYDIKSATPQAVYIEVETGRTYNRPAREFEARYSLINADPQADIGAFDELFIGEIGAFEE